MLKPDILRNKKDFDRLYKKGKSFGSRYVVLFYISNGLEYSRKGFLASKKVGNAVQRNRARRLMKEYYRKYGDRIPEGYDVLFIARNTICDAKFQDIRISMNKVLKRSGLIEMTDRSSKNRGEKK